MVEQRQSILAGFSAVCTATSGVIGNKVLDEPWLSSAGVGLCIAFVAMVCITAAVEFARGPKTSTAPASARVPVPADGLPLPPDGSPAHAHGIRLVPWERVMRHVIIPASVASLLGAAAALLAIALTLVISPGRGVPAAGQPTQVPTTQSPPATSTNSRVPVGAVKVSATPGDAGPGFGDQVDVTVTVTKPLPKADSYWLIAQFMGGTNIVYKAHDPISPARGRSSFTVSVASSSVGSVRTFYVVAEYADSTQLMQQNYDHPNSTWDGNRTSLPDHSFVVSDRVQVTKQRG